VSYIISIIIRSFGIKEVEMTTTISRSELERIRRLAMGDEASTANPRAEKNRLLREKSQEKKKNWPNTLDAIRNKKV
jgi:hypothetical protein